MSQRLTDTFITTNLPGSYFEQIVQSTPVGLATTGSILIIGESSSGPRFSQESDLQSNFYTPDQVDRVIAKYGAGPIVDAMRALAAPADDNRLRGSVGRVYILQTNTNAKASAIVDTNYGTLSDLSYGEGGNKYNFKVSSLQDEIAPFQEGTDLAFPAVAASVVYDSITFTAVTAGVAGNSIALTFDGALDTVSSVTSAWNLANPSNTVSFSGLGSVIPTAGTATLTGGDNNSGAAYNSLTFGVRINGAALQTVTLAGTEATHDTISELIAEIDAQLVGASCVASASGLGLKIEIDADATPWRKGYGKSLEIIELSVGDLADLGLVEALEVSSAEAMIQLELARQDINFSSTSDIGGDIGLEIGYEGTTATLSISGSTMTITRVGGSGANQTIDMSKFTTIGDLASYISSLPGYTASATASGRQKAPSALDKVASLGICSTQASVMPGRIKMDLLAFSTAITNSGKLSFAATDTKGLPAPMANSQFLSGGDKGGSSSLDFSEALDQAEALAVSFVIPLISRNASDDIAEGLTANTSTYSIDSVQALTKTHVLKVSVPKIKGHRSGIVSKWGTFAAIRSAAAILGSSRMSMTCQKVSQVNSLGDIVDYQPWMAAVIAAGMQVAGFNKGIVKKFANVISFTNPAGFDANNKGDAELALDSGLLVLEKTSTKPRWISDQTTYGFDSNFVYNSIQATYIADIISLDLSKSMDDRFTGDSLAEVDAAGGLAFLSVKMDTYFKLKLIGASAGVPLGFRNAKIDMNGPIMKVKVEVKLATLLYFIPISLEFSQISSSAS